MAARESNYLCRLFIVLTVALLIGCGSSDSQSSSAGAISAHLPRKPSGKSSAKSAVLALAGIAAVRILISAADMTILRNSFRAASGSGAIERVPAGTGRRLTSQRRDPDGSVIYQGWAADLTVQAVQPTDAGPGECP